MSSSIETRNYINGQFVESERKFVLKNPATGKVVAEVSHSGEAEIEQAVAAAAVAQAKWIALSGTERAEVIRKWAGLIRAESDKLGALESQSMGRPVSAYPDAYISANSLEYLASLAVNVHGHTSLATPGQLSVVLKQPYGVTAGIIPWNVPVIMFTSKAGHAVAAGNAIIIKSSEKAPLTSIVVAALSKEAGFPDGLIQVVSGLGDTGKILAEHPKIRKVSFTGSTRTGRHIMHASANSNLKAVTLELGGKSPTIIFDDADLESAIPACTFSIAWNSGQICMSNSRIYVHEKVYDKFAEGFAAAFAQYTHGDPLDKATKLGPQADEIQHSIVKGYLEVGNKDGKAILGGQPGEGNFIQPTIFADIPEDSKINKEEVFGPVTVLHKFTDEDDVVAKANDTEYGLYAAVYTQDIDRAIRIATKLEAGSVGVNCTSPTGAPDTSFGGWKQSGIGREGGPSGLSHWLEEKSVFVKVKGL